MLSVIANIPVVIQPREALSVPLGVMSARSCAFEEKLSVNSEDLDDSVAVDRDSLSDVSRLSLESVQFVRRKESDLVPTEIEALFVAGGLQRYLIRNQFKMEAATPEEAKHGCSTWGVLDLPISLQLHIFSFLDAKSLCSVCNVCSHWSWLSCDDLLWRRRLLLDIDGWTSISDSTNPDSYQNDSLNLSQKEIYLRCSPVVAEWSRQNNFFLHRLSSIIRSLWPKKAPRVAMFGPGLESNTRFIVRKILEDKSGMFQTLGMFPGKFEGIGSGFTVKVNNFLTIDLITIYNETKDIRENWSSAERLKKSRMLLQGGQNAGDGERQKSDFERAFELRNAMKELCQTLDAFIFVVDATLPPEELTLALPELFAMTDSRWTQNNAPVLVLSCIPDSRSGHQMSCKTVLHQLQLQELKRPWQVHKCCVDTMEGMEPGLQWMIETCHRR